MLAALRNTLVLSFLLGLGFLAGLFPATSPHSPQQYLFVILNSSSGVFVFISGVMMNDVVANSLKRTLSNPRASVTTVRTNVSWTGSSASSLNDGMN